MGLGGLKCYVHPHRNYYQTDQLVGYRGKAPAVKFDDSNIDN